MFAWFLAAPVVFARDVSVSLSAGPTFFAPSAPAVGVTAAAAIDPAFVAFEAGTAGLPFLAGTTYGRAGASIPLRRTDAATVRLQPMVGLRTLRPAGLLALVLDDDAPAAYGTVTTAVEAVRRVDGWGVVARGTLGFGASLDGAEPIPELGVSAGVAF